jgi:hypothetical protein
MVPDLRILLPLVPVVSGPFVVSRGTPAGPGHPRVVVMPIRAGIGQRPTE